jgi:hypothetical protein
MPLLIFIAIAALAPGLVFFLLHFANALLSDPIVATILLTGLALTIPLSVWWESRRRRP